MRDTVDVLTKTVKQLSSVEKLGSVWLQYCTGSNGHEHSEIVYCSVLCNCPLCESLEELNNEILENEKLREQLEKIGVEADV